MPLAEPLSDLRRTTTTSSSAAVFAATHSSQAQTPIHSNPSNIRSGLTRPRLAKVRRSAASSRSASSTRQEKYGDCNPFTSSRPDSTADILGPGTNGKATAGFIFSAGLEGNNRSQANGAETHKLQKEINAWRPFLPSNDLAGNTSSTGSFAFRSCTTGKKVEDKVNTAEIGDDINIWKQSVLERSSLKDDNSETLQQVIKKWRPFQEDVSAGSFCLGVGAAEKVASGHQMSGVRGTGNGIRVAQIGELQKKVRNLKIFSEEGFVFGGSSTTSSSNEKEENGNIRLADERREFVSGDAKSSLGLDRKFDREGLVNKESETSGSFENKFVFRNVTNSFNAGKFDSGAFVSSCGSTGSSSKVNGASDFNTFISDSVSVFGHGSRESTMSSKLSSRTKEPNLARRKTKPSAGKAGRSAKNYSSSVLKSSLSSEHDFSSKLPDQMSRLDLKKDGPSETTIQSEPNTEEKKSCFVFGFNSSSWYGATPDVFDDETKNMTARRKQSSQSVDSDCSKYPNGTYRTSVFSQMPDPFCTVVENNNEGLSYNTFSSPSDVKNDLNSEGLKGNHMESSSQSSIFVFASSDSLLNAPHRFSSNKFHASVKDLKACHKPKQSASKTIFFTCEEDNVGKMEADFPGSPMECSPYQEVVISNHGISETSAASAEPMMMPSTDICKENWNPDDIEGLVSVTNQLVIDRKSGDTVQEANLPSGESLCFKPRIVCADGNNALENATNSGGAKSEGKHEDEKIEKATEDGKPFSHRSSGESSSSPDFGFAAESCHSSRQRRFRRLHRMDKYSTGKIDKFKHSVLEKEQPSAITRDLPSIPSISRTTNGIEDASKPGSAEACETWRIRGNQAYTKGDAVKAEEYYTRGLNSFPSTNIFKSGNRALASCYSNRAAARMSLGRVREALEDAMCAEAIDPSFMRAKLRIANCHLALGEIEDSMKHYTECLQQKNDSTSDLKIMADASNGLRNAQKVADCILELHGVLQGKISTELPKALEMISNAMSISTHSDALMKMKAETLLMLRRYDEVIKLCEGTAEITEITAISSSQHDCGSSDQKLDIAPKMWCLYFVSKSYFHLGKLDEALKVLEKLEHVKSLAERYGKWSAEFSSLYATVQKLLHLKAAGNEAFQAERYLEAVEHYTAALAYNSDSLPFSAVCFCNRAAAYQALGQISDSIADCSLAIALDPKYHKAISRRATLLEMIRDYGHAASDLQKLISLLERHGESGQSGRSLKSSNHADLSNAYRRLSSVEDEARKGTALNLYLVLGVEPSCTAADIKKAYRKAALRHHPDKAGQFLVKNDNLKDGVWRDIAKDVHNDADRLFKIVGEAYNVLSDETKRLDYDMEEELRKHPNRGCSERSRKFQEKSYSGQNEKNGSRSRTYKSSHRWSEYSNW